MTSWFHARWERRVSLMVADVLPDREREATLRHIETCASCAAQAAEERRIWSVASEDPARQAVVPISTTALLARIHGRLDEASRTEAPLRTMLVPVTVVGLLVVGAIVATLIGRPVPSPSTSPRATQVATGTRIEVPEDMVARMERQVAREQVARFLMEAQDVLVTVASHPHSCDREARRMNVRTEARRSRELLAKRALVDQGSHEAPGAENVMRAVERTLREVAVLEPCARPWELLAIQKDLEESRLLLRIDLVKRELVG